MSSNADQTREALLTEVIRLVQELHPQPSTLANVCLDSSLDHDLGFDSLSRVELLRRLESRFSIRLPERVLLEAETPNDLLHAVLKAGPKTASSPTEFTGLELLGAVEGAPDSAETLIDVLVWHASAHPERPHVYLYDDTDEPAVLTYGNLLDEAHSIASGLQQHDLNCGDSVAIMLPTGKEYLACFYGVLLAGGVPVPIYPPTRPSQIEDHLHRHIGILNNAAAVLLLTVPEAQKVARVFRAQVETLAHVLTTKELQTSAAELNVPALRANDTAFLQYTSGSTGQPKGVVLTHANLLANIRAMGRSIQVDSTDVFVSWLPLYHDMGLIGAWLGSLYYAVPLVLMSPLAFLSHPQRWLWTIHRHRGTLSAAPNFAYELCVSKLGDDELEGLDLSSWRIAFNGAEPVSPLTISSFCRRFERFGFRAAAMAPVYGLAESAVGLAFPPLERGPLIDRIQRKPFLTSGQAIEAEPDDTQVMEFVACGQPLPGYEIRIVDTGGFECKERQQGTLQFTGPSACSGYLRNPEANSHLFDGRWLDTGDLAYIAAGDVYLTGRVKDVIIRAGRNVYPSELEEAVGNIDGIRNGCVAVFGTTDPGTGTERVIIVAETRETDSQMMNTLRAKVLEVATDVLRLAPDDIVLAQPHSVLKTSSGKLRRAAMRELYDQNRIGDKPRAAWRQFSRITLQSVWPSLRKTYRSMLARAYAAYVFLILLLLAPLTWLVVVLLPSLSWGRIVTRCASRLLLQLCGIRIGIEGKENLSNLQHCVFVSNHASYLDAVVLMASLPPTFGFVAKAELRKHFVGRVFLNSIGTEFVERFDKQRGLADARQVTNVIRRGCSLLFFPEGTFNRIPGLLPFHMGAFAASVEAGVPLVPITLHGTRSILRGEDLFVRRGQVSVKISPPIVERNHDWEAAVGLRDAARSHMLKTLNEPDLEAKILIV